MSKMTTALDLTVLKGLFQSDNGPSIQSCELEPIKSTEHPSSASGAILYLEIPETLECFKGHFPEQPVLPGVMQIDWAGQFAKVLFNNLGCFSRLINVKFKSMVMPGESLYLKLTYKHDKAQVVFRYFNESTEFSSGTFAYLNP